MNQSLKEKINKSLLQLFGNELKFEVDLQQTKENFEGDYTLVIFPFTKILKRNPEVIGKEIGNFLLNELEEVQSFNLVGGFLNLSLSYNYFCEELITYSAEILKKNNSTIMVEYSSPNTNKPLHLGHIRNNLLGIATANILAFSGHKVIKTQIINDRGIHICKSMVAWKNFSNGETPISSELKGDHLVGKYYVLFDKEYRNQLNELIEKGMTAEEAKVNAPLMIEAQQMLLKWEEGDNETLTLWKTMNNWVYDGFKETYGRLGVAFNKVQYESDTYLLGKNIVQEGINKSIFFQKEDGSVWCDLTADGFDEKLVLRKDGTSVYITQDLGTAIERFKDLTIEKLIYVVGNEQDYHFKVLFEILKKLKYSWADNLFHLSYAMVDLPEGKMKSREGTVVDADDLMQEMHSTAKKISMELGKLEAYTNQEKSDLYETIGMGALKYYILKVDPKKNILFDPNASIDFQGNTGPFIQYTYARIRSILSKQKPMDFVACEMGTIEKKILRHLLNYSEVIYKAAETLNPSLVANYVYDLVKLFNTFYQSTPILKEENQDKLNFRLHLSEKVSQTIFSGMALLGISLPNRM
ncbi:MAG: arginine--tRNA ligase [Solirubrobacteraceae bacterium]